MQEFIGASFSGYPTTAEFAGITAGCDFNHDYSGTFADPRSRARGDNLDNILEFPGGRLEIYKSSPHDGGQSVSTILDDKYLIDMSLSRQPTTWTCANSKVGGEVGRIFLVPPGETISISMPQGQLRTIRCFLDRDLIDPFLAKQVLLDRRTLCEAMQLGGGQIEWLMWRLYREMQKAEIGSVQIIEGLAKQLAVEIIRRFKPSHRGFSRHAGGLSPWRLRLIEKRVNEEGDFPSVQELAQLCDLSVRHLSRAYRTETGQTLGKYIEAVMAQRAHGMLIEGIPVRRIAHALGYSRAGNFSHAFRRATGLLPTEVKRLRPSRATAPASRGAQDITMGEG